MISSCRSAAALRSAAAALLTLWAWLGPLPAARAQMIVAGPATPAAGAVQDWQARRLPPAFRADRPCAVFLLSDPDMDSYLRRSGIDPRTEVSSYSGGGRVDGLFDRRSDRLSLRIPATGEVSLQTLAHEYGHFVWFHLLSGDDRKRYGQCYRRQREADRLVTEYARESQEEGFAEAFAYYLMRRPFLQARDAESDQFLARWEVAHVGGVGSGDTEKASGAG